MFRSDSLTAEKVSYFHSQFLKTALSKRKVAGIEEHQVVVVQAAGPSVIGHQPMF